MRVAISEDPVCNMHACLRQPMRLCRWAGVFPVEGLNKKTCSKLRFNLHSTYTFYYSMALLGQFLLTGASAYHFIINDLSFGHLTLLLFYLTAMITGCFLVKLASNWPTLVKEAGCIERRIACISSGSCKPENYTRIVCMTLFLSLVEHILSVIYRMDLIIQCNRDEKLNWHLLEHFLISSGKFLFNIISYSYWNALLFELLNLQSTFLWNITDAMTMCVSLYLTSYFRDLKKFIEHQQQLKTTQWEEIRLHYSDLVKLVQIVDSNMCYLILLSFFTNLFFICVQLFSLFNYSNYPVIMDCHDGHVIIAVKSIYYYVYYCYSSLFLFGRATLTSLLAANVNTEAMEPFYVLQHVPTEEYTIEVQRFIRQTRYTTTAISGLFFDVTREMILTVIGTIAKYELVLLQFSVKTYDALKNK